MQTVETDSRLEAHQFVSLFVGDHAPNHFRLTELLVTVDAQGVRPDQVERLGELVLDFVPATFSEMLSIIDDVGMNCSIRQGLPNVECLHQLIGLVAYAGLTEFCLTYLESKSLRAKTQGESK